MKSLFSKLNNMDKRGNTFIEYLVIAGIVLLATAWFFDGGNFQGARQNAESAFRNLAVQIAR